MANIIVKLSGQHSAAVVASSLASAGKKSYLPSFLRSLGEALGPFGAKASVQILNADAVAASGLISVVDNAKVTANDTFKVGTVLLTAKAAGASTNEFNIGASATATALNMARAFGVYSAGVLTASSAVGVVTVKCNTAGTIGNSLPITVVQADVGTTSDAALSGGVDDTGVAKDYTAL